MGTPSVPQRADTKPKKKRPNGNKRRRVNGKADGGEAGLQLLRTHQLAAAAGVQHEYYSSDTEPPGGFHGAAENEDDDEDDDGTMLHSRVVDEEPLPVGNKRKAAAMSVVLPGVATWGARDAGGHASGAGEPVDIYGNKLPTVDPHTDIAHALSEVDTHTVLHTRAEEWYMACVPTPDEHTVRFKVVAELRGIVSDEWGGQAQLQVFGSSATGLLLKGGDIDMVILGLGVESKDGGGGFAASDRAKVAKHLSKLAKALKKAKMVQHNSLLLISKARVPIIKFKENLSGLGLPVDISVGCVNGLHTVAWVRTQIQCYPLCVPLAVILKRFLEQRKMNEPVNGGIGGYLLINLVVSYLKRAYRQHNVEVGRAEGVTGDLGMLILGFFEYYATGFDYNKHAVASAHPTGVKAKLTLTFTAGVPFLAVEDPQQLNRDIGGPARQFPELRNEFAHALATLKPMLRNPQAPTLQSMLSRRAPRSSHSPHGSAPSPKGTPKKSRGTKPKPHSNQQGTPITSRALELMGTPKSSQKSSAAGTTPKSAPKSQSFNGKAAAARKEVLVAKSSPKPRQDQSTPKKQALALAMQSQSALSQFMEEDIADGTRQPGRVKGKRKSPGKGNKVENPLKQGKVARAKKGMKLQQGQFAGQQQQQGQAGGHLGVKRGGVEKGAKKPRGGDQQGRRRSSNAASPAPGGGAKGRHSNQASPASGGKGGGKGYMGVKSGKAKSRGWSHEM